MAARGTTIKDVPGDSAARAGKCLLAILPISNLYFVGQGQCQVKSNLYNIGQLF